MGAGGWAAAIVGMWKEMPGGGGGGGGKDGHARLDTEPAPPLGKLPTDTSTVGPQDRQDHKTHDRLVCAGTLTVSWAGASHITDAQADKFRGESVGDAFRWGEPARVAMGWLRCPFPERSGRNR